MGSRSVWDREISRFDSCHSDFLVDGQFDDFMNTEDVNEMIGQKGWDKYLAYTHVRWKSLSIEEQAEFIYRDIKRRLSNQDAFEYRSKQYTYWGALGLAAKRLRQDDCYARRCSYISGYGDWEKWYINVSYRHHNHGWWNHILAFFETRV